MLKTVMFRKPVLLLIKCCVMLQAHPELFLTAVRVEFYIVAEVALATLYFSSYPSTLPRKKKGIMV